MSIDINSKGQIRATGKDANGLFIAMSADETLLEWEQKQTGSPEFQQMVKEAIKARGIGDTQTLETGKNMSQRKFYRQVVRVEILSEDRFSSEDLSEIHEAITEGDCSGHVEVVEDLVVDAKTMAALLIKQGSDPSFFKLDEHGNDVE